MVREAVRQLEWGGVQVHSEYSQHSVVLPIDIAVVPQGVATVEELGEVKSEKCPLSRGAQKGHCSPVRLPGLAIEVHGPFHFCQNSGREMQDSLVRGSMLSSMGWKVGVVSLHDWKKWQQSGEELCKVKSLLLCLVEGGHK